MFLVERERGDSHGALPIPISRSRWTCSNRRTGSASRPGSSTTTAAWACAFDCNKPLPTKDIPLARLPELIAPALIPAMPGAMVRNVHSTRGVFCDAPRIQTPIGDERGHGDIEYDTRGKVVEARVR